MTAPYRGAEGQLRSMDFDRFYVWRKHFAIVELSQAPLKPVTCHKVYAELVADGLAQQDTHGYCTLVPGVDVALARRQSSRLLNELVRDNQRLVRKLVSQLARRSTAFLEEEDLFQAGCLGFMRALEKFDPDRFADKKRGASFATYLRHWVRHFMQASIVDQQTIKQPRGHGMPYAIYKRIEDFTQKHGRAPEPHELGTIKSAAKKREVPITQAMLDQWYNNGKSIISLDRVNSARNGFNGQRLTGFEAGTVSEEVGQGELPDSSKSPEQLMTRAQLGLKAAALLERFGPITREYIEEVREGVPAEVSARKRGVTEGYVRKMRRDAVDRLRTALEWES